MPWSIATALSTKSASLRDLGEVLSVEDVYDLIEIATIDEHNRRAIDHYLRKKEDHL